MKETSQTDPEFLYKVTSQKDWLESKSKPAVKLGSIDESFIHLATKEQIHRILEKFWPKNQNAVILRLTTSRLRGRLIKERNPGGSTEYYHLYDGSIPLDAVAQVMSRSDIDR